MMATFAAITGYPLTNDMGEDSVNAWHAFLGRDEGIRESMIHQDITGTLGIRVGKWKLVPAARKTPLPNGARLALFNMETDWLEKNNLADAHPEIVQRLQQTLVRQKQAGRTAPIRN